MQAPNRFTDYFEDFKSNNIYTRQQNAIKFRIQCEKESSELLSDPRQMLLQDVELFIKYLANQPQENLQHSSILIIQQFIQLKNKLISLQVIEEQLLTLCSDKKKLIAQAAAASIAFFPPEKNYELFWHRAFEWSKSTQTRFNAVCVINNLLIKDPNAGTKIQSNQGFINDLWIFILESKEINLLGIECFVQILNHKQTSHVFNVILQNLTQSPQNALCSLMIMHQLFDQNLTENRQLSQILGDNYQNLLNQLLGKPYKDIQIQREIGQILPYFAKFKPQVFAEQYMKQAFDYLFDKYEKLNLLVTLGKMVEVLGSPSYCFFQQIIICILQSIEPKKKQMDFSNEALTCINTLAKAAPEQLSQHIKVLLDAMFIQGLSSELVQALSSVAENLSKIKAMGDIEERLFQLIDYELNGTNPMLLSSPQTNMLSPKYILQGSHQPKLQLALETLLQFQFENISLNNFSGDCLVKYLVNSQQEIRIAAAKAIIKLIKVEQTNYIVVNNILSQVIILGLTDVSEEVREAVMTSINKSQKFDDFLAQKENLDILFIGVNDFCFGVKSNIVELIGRLSKIHPVIVLPHIREILLGLIFELDYSQINITKGENVMLLKTIVQYCSNLIQPFIKSVCKSVLKINDKDNQLQVVCIQTLSELFSQCGKELLEFFKETVDKLVKILKEGNDELKFVALGCLQNLSIGSWLPVVPYYMNIELIDVILTLIKQDVNHNVQKQAAKTLVILGALDYNVKQFVPIGFEEISRIANFRIDEDFEQLRICQHDKNIIIPNVVSHGQVMYDSLTGQIIDKFDIIKLESKEQVIYKMQGVDYVGIVLNLIKQMLIDNNCSLYTEAIICFRRIIQFIQNKQVLNSTNILIEQIIQQIFNIVLKSSSLVAQEEYIQQLIYIISALNTSIKQYLDPLLQMAYKLWDNEALTSLVFSLIEEVTLKFPGYDFIQQNTEVVQKLLQYYTVLPENLEVQTMSTIIRSYNTLVILLPSLKTQIKILLPCLLKMATLHQKKELCVATLDCIGRICVNVHIEQLQSSIIQTLLKLMILTSEQVKPQMFALYQNQQYSISQQFKHNIIGYKAFETLHYVAVMLQQQFNTYVPMVNKIIVDNNYQSTVLSAIITINLRNQFVSQEVLIAAIQQFKESVIGQTQSKLLQTFINPPIKNLIVLNDLNPDLSIDKFLEILLQKNQTSLFMQFEPLAPQKIGVDALAELLPFPTPETMPKKDWVCDDIQESEQWRGWLSQLQNSLIKYNPVEVLRYCQELCRNNAKTARDLFNYAYYSFFSDGNLSSDMRTQITSTLKNSLNSKSIPKDILQQFLDLVEFFEHNGEQLQSNVLNDVKLGNISENCFAYARCLRYREQDYQQSPMSTMDILIRINKRLGNHESSKGVIFIELQRLNQTGIQLLFEIVIKRSKMLLKEMKDSKITDYISYISSNFDSALVQEVKNVAISAARTQKSLHEGTLGGIFIECRPIFAGLKSKIMQCDYQQMSNYLVQLTMLLSQQILGVEGEKAELIVTEIIKVVSRILKEPFKAHFGPKPQWFEILNWYEKALEGYKEQISINERILMNNVNDPFRFKEVLKNHQALVCQKISCLYHLGCYHDVILEAQNYTTFMKQFSQKEEAYKLEKYIVQFNALIAKYCVYSSIEIQEGNISKWLQSLDNTMLSQRLLIQAIHNVQMNDLDAAEVLVTQLMEICISPIIAGTLESYERAYDNIIQLQQAIELKEVINFKKNNIPIRGISMTMNPLQNAEQLVQKLQLKSIWVRRLANLYQDLDTWIGILRVRQLLIDKTESIPVYLSFAIKCMASGRLNLAKNTLEQLLGCQPEKKLQFVFNKQTQQFYASIPSLQDIPEIISNKYEVVYTYCKYLFHESDPASKVTAFVYLMRLSENLKQQSSPDAELLQRIFIRLAQWFIELIQVLQPELQLLQMDTSIDQQTEFKIIDRSAVDGLFNGLEKFIETTEIEQSQSDHQSLSATFTRNTTAQTPQILCGKMINEMVQQNNYLDNEQMIPGYLSAKQALSWFEAAEKVQKESVKVERCISHTTSFIVELIQNQEIIQKDKQQLEQLKKIKLDYLEKSLQSHFRCMKFKEIRLPSALRLLTLWFQYGNEATVEQAFINGLAALDIDYWIEVVPQLIARSTSTNKKIKYLIQQLLIQIGLKHPQLLIYPLMVATKRDQINQQSEALSILDQIRRAHLNEVDQTVQIGQELTRIAITWPESCMDGLFQAIFNYNNDKKQIDFLNAVAILQQQYDQPAETPSEELFCSQYMEQFKQGWDLLKKGLLANDLQSTEQSRSVLFDLHTRLKNDIQKQFIIELPHVSPILSKINKSLVELPGSNMGQKITKFLLKMNVIASKQRPRKIAIVANDGEIYAYLLKGREDQRQDERVMQLLGLINQLLQGEQFSQKHLLYIDRYPCVPIGKNTGLLFWVPKSDTVNDLVKNYRIQKLFQDNSEDKQLQTRAANYTQLSLVQKLDTFKFVFQFCPGLDLRATFWEQAISSENWLQKRTNYTVSLAVMSMVGYILGLGDRHPANIMINRASGQILHIDYGDCFEACQRRLKLPEKIPFRLTRILVNAMEVCGTNGLFLKACETTMKVLRNNKDSILAILQTFIYDPLLGWKAMHGSLPEFEDETQIKKRDDDGLSGISPVEVVKRIENKLVGRDFEGYNQLAIDEQVQALIKQAQNLENLCQLYFGWCPLW